MAQIFITTYEILETNDATFIKAATTPPYRKSFRIWRLFVHKPAYLLVWYTTGYPYAAPELARVLINGTEIGRLPPHPWQGEPNPDHSVVALHFDAGLLRLFNPFTQRTNELAIDGPPGNVGNEYLWVGKVILHYTEEWSVPQAT
jgi:hypothetical protein